MRISSLPTPTRQGIAPTRHHEELWAYSAERMLAYLMMKKINPEELTAASLARIDAVNPAVNAVIDVYREEALDTATRLRRRRKSKRLLHGVPVTVKDNIETAGHAMSEGVAALRDHICADDAPLVAHLKDNGAVIVGRTNCPPHCWQLFCDNDLYGPTSNPLNPLRTPGGSSGGAAVSVATGMVPIAHGNDIAGSIRYPAYANAVVGLRPTNGAIPGSVPAGDKPFAFQLFASQGVLARTVADAFIGFDAMRGYTPGDPANLDASVRYPESPRTVGVYMGSEIAPVDDPVRDAVLHAARAFESMGWNVEYLDTTVFERLFELEAVLLFAEFLHSGKESIAEGGEILDRGLDVARALIADIKGDGYHLTLDDYLRSLAARGTAIRDLRALMGDYPVVLTPVSTEIPFLQNEDQTADRARALRMAYASWPMDALPVAGVPGLVLPTDVVADGINLGVQLTCRQWDEATLRVAANDLEHFFDLSHDPVDPMPSDSTGERPPRTAGIAGSHR